MSTFVRNGTNQVSPGSKALVSYDMRPSPRGPNEIDVRSYIDTLQTKLNIAKGELKEYKKLIETYRSEIASMQRELETLNNDNLKQLVPVIQHDTEFFNQAMAAQRQENINLQQRLTDLKKDKAQMQYQIGQYQLRIAQMEANIGINNFA